MALDKWRLQLPVLMDPVSRLEHLVWYCRPIEDARGPLYPATMAYVIGVDRFGSARKFTVRLDDYNRAVLSPKKLLEVEDIAAPGGVIYDPQGRALKDS